MYNATEEGRQAPVSSELPAGLDDRAPSAQATAQPTWPPCSTLHNSLPACLREASGTWWHGYACGCFLLLTGGTS